MQSLQPKSRGSRRGYAKKVQKPTIASLSKQLEQVVRRVAKSKQEHFYDFSFGPGYVPSASGGPPATQAGYAIEEPFFNLLDNAEHGFTLNKFTGDSIFVKSMEIRLHCANTVWSENFHVGSRRNLRVTLIEPKDYQAFLNNYTGAYPTLSYIPWDYDIYQYLYFDSDYTIGDTLNENTTVGNILQANSAPSMIFIRKHIKINRKFEMNRTQATGNPLNGIFLVLSTDQVEGNTLYIQGNIRIYFTTES